MVYEIESKNDFSAGASLIVRLPEEDLDKSALYTILSERPDFILPLRYRSIEGQIEIVYQVGLLRPLQDFPDTCPAKECTDMWAKILNPFLECGDWFMKPYSFLLDTKYLFFDSDKKTVCYVYIPSIRDSCGYEDLRVMAAEVAGIVTADDVSLENKILRMIMRDFNPKDFLRNLKPYSGMKPHLPAPGSVAEPEDAPESSDTAHRITKKAAPGRQPPGTSSESASGAMRDIVMNFSAKEAFSRNSATDPEEIKTSGRKRDKRAKRPKDKDTFFSRLKNSVQEEVIIS